MFTPLAVYTKAAVAVEYLLDYGTAIVAYSTARKLKSDYTGYAFEVTRTSDSATQDIGFDSNENVDTSALSSFIGANTGVITKLYDQSGNGIDVVQATAATAPTIIDAGTLKTLGPSHNFPTAYFEQDKLEMASAMTGDFKVVSVMAAANVTNLSTGFSGIFWSDPNNGYSWGDYNSTTQVCIIRSNGNRLADISYTANTPVLVDVFYNVDGGTNASYNKVNTTTATTTLATGYFAATEFDQVTLGTYATLWTYGNISEWVMFDSTQESNKTNLRANMNNYYSFY